MQRRRAHAINARWAYANTVAGLSDTPRLDLCGAQGAGVPLIERGGLIVIPSADWIPAFWWDDEQATFKDIMELDLARRLQVLNAASAYDNDPFGIKRPRFR